MMTFFARVLGLDTGSDMNMKSKHSGTVFVSEAGDEQPD